MQIDLTTEKPLDRTDGFLLLLGAQNAVLFRADHWSRDVETSSRVIASVTNTLQAAMWRLRKQEPRLR
jgi:hypothetical protein